MAKRQIFSWTSLLFLAGAVVLTFFILLGGIKESSPLNEFYFLQADTGDIANAPGTTRWTLWGYCEVTSGGRNTNCSGNKPAFAFQPAVTFHTTDGVPQDFIDNHSSYFYLSRFGFPLYVIGLFFVVISLFLSLCTFGSRLAAGVASTSAFFGLLFVAAAASVLTSCYVMARNQFNDQNSGSADLGVKLFAFMWAVVALVLLSFIGLCCSCISRKDTAGHTRTRSTETTERAAPLGGRGFFSVNRRKHNSQSSFFAENESQTPVVRPEYE